VTRRLWRFLKIHQQGFIGRFPKTTNRSMRIFSKSWDKEFSNFPK